MDQVVGDLKSLGSAADDEVALIGERQRRDRQYGHTQAEPNAFPGSRPATSLCYEMKVTGTRELTLQLPANAGPDIQADQFPLAQLG